MCRFVLPAITISLTFAAAQTVVPPYLLPQPTGRYPVGRIRLHWIDREHRETLAGGTAQPRELNLEIWYPSKNGHGTQVGALYTGYHSYQDPFGRKVFKDEFDSAAALVESEAIKTHSSTNAPVAGSSKRFPVLIFSHGLGVPPEGYTSQLQDLASHGFVVVGIEHTYDAFVSVFPDGRVIDYEDEQWDKQKTPAEHAAYTKARVDVWTSDIVFVLNQLFAVNDVLAGTLLSGHLDIHRLGVFGHSMGGLAAIAACQKDRRIGACLDEDSLIYGTPFTHPEGAIDQPYMVFLTAFNFSPSRTDAQLARAGFDRATFDGNVKRSQEELKVSLRSKSGAATLAVLRDASIEHMGFSGFQDPPVRR